MLIKNIFGLIKQAEKIKWNLASEHPIFRVVVFATYASWALFVVSWFTKHLSTPRSGLGVLLFEVIQVVFAYKLVKKVYFPGESGRNGESNI